MILTDERLGADAISGERWRPAPGFEDKYLVSSMGRVYSKPRPGTRRTGPHAAGLLTGTLVQATGYMRVQLHDGPKFRRIYLHRLMAEAFLPKPAGATVVRHLNDNKLDNTISNLAWGTVSDNAYDKVANGKHHNANKTECFRGHKYTDVTVYVHPDGRRKCRPCRRITAELRKERAAA